MEVVEDVFQSSLLSVDCCIPLPVPYINQKALIFRESYVTLITTNLCEYFLIPNVLFEIRYAGVDRAAGH